MSEWITGSSRIDSGIALGRRARRGGFETVVVAAGREADVEGRRPAPTRRPSRFGGAGGLGSLMEGIAEKGNAKYGAGENAAIERRNTEVVRQMTEEREDGVIPYQGYCTVHTVCVYGT